MKRFKPQWLALTNMLLLVVLLLALIFSGWLAFFAQPAIEIQPTTEAQNTDTEPSPTTAKSAAATANGNANRDSATNDKASGTAAASGNTRNGNADSASADVPKLIIPVAGVKREQLQDTYQAARSANRVHNAIDIMAARGTPVLAVENGTIKRLFFSDRGGNTIYQLSRDGKLIYYYAHLERYADGLAAGKEVKQGEVIAYVGDSGNAGAGNYHLHFSIWRITDPKRFWDGENINPYLWLH
ncbi:MAG: M23 family metallopeptidase [Acidobacteria bacterium]|nr:M23 family metallopeptidase [Acidobacteriota bacterium]